MTDKTLAPLSPAETEILRLVWQSENATVQKVCDSLPPARNITYATVQTLLRRLEKKGYLKHKTIGKAHVFSAAAERDDVIGSAVGSFLDRLFGGDPAGLMHHLARHGKISEADIEKLKNIVQQDESESGGK